MRVLIPLLFAVWLTACVEPADRRPGLRLPGEVVTGVVEDWSFTDEHREIFVETRTPYWIPHSVTISCGSLDGRLYVGARNPTEKRWVGYLQRDPDVRLSIDGRIYERRLEPVDDPDEAESVYRAFAAKYGRDFLPPSERPPLRYFRVVERSRDS